MSANTIPCKYHGQVVTFDARGWINATMAATRFGKRPIDWLRLDETAQYVEALAEALGMGKVSQPHFGLVKTNRGGKEPGTWLHPKLAVAFARWLSVDFAVWCDMQIDSLIHGGSDSWRQLRQEAAVGHKGLCDALSLSRAEEGKPTKPYHFMNEAKLINGVLFGEFRRRDREAMTADELNMVAILEQRDTFLIGRGLDYQARKKALTEYAQQIQSKRIQSAGSGGEVT